MLLPYMTSHVLVCLRGLTESYVIRGLLAISVRKSILDESGNEYLQIDSVLCCGVLSNAKKIISQRNKLSHRRK